jgi:hypothetical protein
MAAPANEPNPTSPTRSDQLKTVEDSLITLPLPLDDRAAGELATL